MPPTWHQVKGPIPSAAGATAPGPADDAAQGQRALWLAVALFPLAFAAGLVVGEGVITLQGYDAVAVPPIGARLLAAVPALLITVVPGVAAFVFGLRASRAGRRSGRIAASVGLVIVAVVVGINLAAAIFGG